MWSPGGLGAFWDAPVLGPLGRLHMRVQGRAGQEDDDRERHGYSRDGKANCPRYLRPKKVC